MLLVSCGPYASVLQFEVLWYTCVHIQIYFLLFKDIIIYYIEVNQGHNIVEYSIKYHTYSLYTNIHSFSGINPVYDMFFHKYFIVIVTNLFALTALITRKKLYMNLSNNQKT